MPCPVVLSCSRSIYFGASAKEVIVGEGMWEEAGVGLQVKSAAGAVCCIFFFLSLREVHQRDQTHTVSIEKNFS